MATISYLFGLVLFMTILTAMSMTAIGFLRSSDRPDLVLGVRPVRVKTSERYSSR